MHLLACDSLDMISGCVSIFTYSSSTAKLDVSNEGESVRLFGWVHTQLSISKKKTLRLSAILLWNLCACICVEDAKLREARRPDRPKREVDRQRECNIQQGRKEAEAKTHIDVDGMENEGITPSSVRGRRQGKSPSLAGDLTISMQALVSSSLC